MSNFICLMIMVALLEIREPCYSNEMKPLLLAQADVGFASISGKADQEVEVTASRLISLVLNRPIFAKRQCCRIKKATKSSALVRIDPGSRVNIHRQ